MSDDAIRSRDEASGDQGPDGAGGPSYDPSIEGYAGISSSGLEEVDEIRDARDFAEMIVDTVREGLLVLDYDMGVKSANQSFYKMFDTSPEETIGRSVYNLGEGQWDMPELRRLLEEILPRDKVFNDFEVVYDFDRVGRKAVLLNARQLNEHQLILLAIEDVSERRRSERRLKDVQERFDLIVQNARDHAIMALDADGRISTWNPGAENIFGWTEREVLGKPVDIIFPPEAREKGTPEEELETARATGTARDDRWQRRKDGSTFWASGFVVALKENGQHHGYVKILRDDTETKEAQEDLRRLTETLEAQVEERTRRVRDLASSLTMAEQQERRRLAQVLHDNLQQVLYAAQMKLTVAGQDAESGDDEALGALLEDVRDMLRQSVDLTRSLTVDLSPPILKSEGLADSLQWLQSQMKELHDIDVSIEAEHSFHTPEEDMRVLLFRVVRELLFNVAKHSGAKAATVSVRDVNHHVEIAVADSGTGFDVEEAERRAPGGKGFGLFNARERLGLFGGRLDIDSTPGEGTRVTVSVPLELS